MNAVGCVCCVYPVVVNGPVLFVYLLRLPEARRVWSLVDTRPRLSFAQSISVAFRRFDNTRPCLALPCPILPYLTLYHLTVRYLALPYVTLRYLTLPDVT